MFKPSPAQKRKAFCGPAFRQSYIDDGWRAGAAHIVDAFVCFRRAAEIRKQLAAGKIDARDAGRIAYLSLLKGRSQLFIGRRMTPLPA